jgi:hypothetical protein
VKQFMRLRPTPAMVVAVIAVVLASVGSATAARLITSAQIKNNSVTSKDIKNRSLLRRDFKPGQLLRGPQGPRGAQGLQGAQGPQGLRGAAGAPGRDGIVKLRYVFSPIGSSDGQVQGFEEAVCPPDAPNVLGGGVVTESTVTGQQAVNSSFPSDGAFTGDPGRSGWFVAVDNNAAAGTELGFQAYAICSSSPDVGGDFRQRLTR